jgi:hypothetical protein
VFGSVFALPPIWGSNIRSIAWNTVINANGSTISAADFSLQLAINNRDSEFIDADTSTVTTGDTRVFTPTSQANFARISCKLTYTVAIPKIAASLSL